MKKQLPLFTKLLLAIFASIIMSGSLFAQSGIFAGGPTYYDRNFSINELRNSGYTFVIVWTIHVMNTNGDLNFNAEFPIVTNGQYIGASSYPYFASDMAMLKTAPTSINRLEIGLSAAGSSTFDHIRTLVNSEGTDPGSKLYENFKALKEAIPGIDAINFDDESTYDAASATAFAVMLADLGYKVTLAPYTAYDFWNSLATNTNSQRPGTVDGVYLQCYDGGAGNNPCSWTSIGGGLPVFPGLWTRYSDQFSVEDRMNAWQDQCGITGGWIWLYDHIKNSGQVAGYANAINTALDIKPLGQATYPTPANGTTNVSRNIDLSWTASDGIVYNRVYFGTNPTPGVGELKGYQAATATTFDPGVLGAYTTYYWRIDQLSSTETVNGQVWSFTTGGDGSPAYASNPNPVNGASNFSLTADLSWTAGSGASYHMVYFGTNSSPTYKGYQAASNTTFDPGTLTANTTYYWRIDEYNSTGTTTGVVWSFTTGGGGLSALASNPNPYNGTTNVGLTTDLSWTAGSGASYHMVYFGTNSSPAYKGYQAASNTTFDPGTLTANTTYYWRIDEYNNTGTTTGVVWSFTTGSTVLPTLPVNASNPNPVNGASYVSRETDLSWTAGSGTSYHRVYFGTNYSPAYQGAQAASATTFDPGALAAYTTYYWRINEYNSTGTTTGPLWSFTTGATGSSTLPVNATNPNPVNGATHINLTADLSWTQGSGTTTHYVYFGTSSSPTYKGSQAASNTTFDPGALTANTTYYWRIDENNSNGTSTGQTWSFTTGNSGYIAPLKLSITFDAFPNETSWAIYQGSISMASGGPYGYGTSTTVESIYLNPGNYSFIMYDVYADGICCNNGNGSFTLTDFAGAEIFSGGSFGSSVSKEFSIISGYKTTTEIETLPAVNTFDYELTVFPNPFNSTIKISAKEAINMVYLLDMNGKVLRSDKMQKTKELNFDELAEGMYLLKVEYTNGKQEIKKLIKKD